MPTEALVFDYAPPRPRGRFVVTLAARGWHVSVAVGCWCWRNRHHLLGVGGAVVASLIVSASMDARVVLNTPVYGGCGAGRSEAYANLPFRPEPLVTPDLLADLAAQRVGRPHRKNLGGDRPGLVVVHALSDVRPAVVPLARAVRSSAMK